MDLRHAILERHSKSQNEKIVKWIGKNQDRFDQLFKLFLDNETIIAQRASWAMSNCVINHPSLIKKHFGRLLKNLERTGLHDAVKRNSIRLMENLEIPVKFQGAVMDLCFRYITDPHEKVAVKAFSITVLHNLSRLFPEISQELKLILEERWDYETAAFRVRAKKFLSTSNFKPQTSNLLPPVKLLKY